MASYAPYPVKNVQPTAAWLTERMTRTGFSAVIVSTKCATIAITAPAATRCKQSSLKSFYKFILTESYSAQAVVMRSQANSGYVRGSQQLEVAVEKPARTHRVYVRSALALECHYLTPRIRSAQLTKTSS